MSKFQIFFKFYLCLLKRSNFCSIKILHSIHSKSKPQSAYWEPNKNQPKTTIDKAVCNLPNLRPCGHNKNLSIEACEAINHFILKVEENIQGKPCGLNWDTIKLLLSRNLSTNAIDVIHQFFSMIQETNQGNASRFDLNTIKFFISKNLTAIPENVISELILIVEEIEKGKMVIDIDTLKLILKQNFDGIPKELITKLILLIEKIKKGNAGIDLETFKLLFSQNLDADTKQIVYQIISMDKDSNEGNAQGLDWSMINRILNQNSTTNGKDVVSQIILKIQEENRRSIQELNENILNLSFNQNCNNYAKDATIKIVLELLEVIRRSTLKLDETIMNLLLSPDRKPNDDLSLIISKIEESINRNQDQISKAINNIMAKENLIADASDALTQLFIGIKKAVEDNKRKTGDIIIKIVISNGETDYKIDLNGTMAMIRSAIERSQRLVREETIEIVSNKNSITNDNDGINRLISGIQDVVERNQHQVFKRILEIISKQDWKIYLEYEFSEFMVELQEAIENYQQQIYTIIIEIISNQNLNDNTKVRDAVIEFMPKFHDIIASSQHQTQTTIINIIFLEQEFNSHDDFIQLMDKIRDLIDNNQQQVHNLTEEIISKQEWNTKTRNEFVDILSKIEVAVQNKTHELETLISQMISVSNSNVSGVRIVTQTYLKIDQIIQQNAHSLAEFISNQKSNANTSDANTSDALMQIISMIHDNRVVNVQAIYEIFTALFNENSNINISKFIHKVFLYVQNKIEINAKSLDETLVQIITSSKQNDSADISQIKKSIKHQYNELNQTFFKPHLNLTLNATANASQTVTDAFDDVQNALQQDEFFVQAAFVKLYASENPNITIRSSETVKHAYDQIKGAFTRTNKMINDTLHEINSSEEQNDIFKIAFQYLNDAIHGSFDRLEFYIFAVFESIFSKDQSILDRFSRDIDKFMLGEIKKSFNTHMFNIKDVFEKFSTRENITIDSNFTFIFDYIRRETKTSTGMVIETIKLYIENGNDDAFNNFTTKIENEFESNKRKILGIIGHLLSGAGPNLNISSQHLDDYLNESKKVFEANEREICDVIKKFGQSENISNGSMSSISNALVKAFGDIEHKSYNAFDLIVTTAITKYNLTDDGNISKIKKYSQESPNNIEKLLKDIYGNLE